MEHSGGPQAELLELLEFLRERRATRAQLQRIEQLVLHDVAAMDLYVRYMAMTASLRQQLGGLPGLPRADFPGSTQAPPRAKPRQAPPRWVRRAMGAVALMAVAAALGLLVWPAGRPPEARPGIARLEQVSGQVHVVNAEGNDREVTADSPIGSGDTVRTRGPHSSAVLVYADGTRLVLVGHTSVTCTEADAHHVVVHEGTLTATVTPQPTDHPMTIATPEAKLRVVGTRFSLESRPDRTALSVTEGRVRFTRITDGTSVDVPGGRRVVVMGASDLVVSDIPPTPDLWDADFEQGLPRGWQMGRLVGDGLPQGSGGAVHSVREQSPPAGRTPYHGIVTNTDWTNGLFAIDTDTHLHMIYKLDRPDWVQVFMGTRPKDLSAATGATIYLLEPWEAAVDEQWWAVPAGRWRHAVIPLAKFRGVIRPAEHPAPQEVCFGFTFSSQEHDRGLVIDRLWVTRGGPGTVEIKKLPGGTP